MFLVFLLSLLGAVVVYVKYGLLPALVFVVVFGLFWTVDVLESGPGSEV